MSERIRIMHVFSWLGPNGVAELLFITAKFNLKAKYDLSFIFYSTTERFLGRRIEELRCPVYEFNLSPNVYDVRVIPKLFKHLRTYKPHIVHFYDSSSIIGRIVAKMVGIPVIISNEVRLMEWSGAKFRDIFLSRFKRTLDFLPDKVIACSEAVRKQRDPKGSEKFMIMYCPFDLTMFPDVMPPFNGNVFKNGAYPVIGNISRMFPGKGHKCLIQATPKIIAAFPSARIRIVGTGPLIGELKALAESLGLGEAIQFTGFVEDLYPEFSLMDIFVFPSLTEGFPLTLMEAMAAELPIVASSVGGIPEMIDDGNTGLLVPPQNPDALADAIINVLSNFEQAKQMGKRGKQKAQNEFAPERYIQKLDALYQELLEAKGMV